MSSPIGRRVLTAALLAAAALPQACSSKPSGAGGGTGSGTPPPIVPSGQHPAFLLDQVTRGVLAAKAAEGDPTWTALKANCDALLGGTVSPPDAIPTDLPDVPTSNDYQGTDYLQFATELGLCYQIEKQLGREAGAAQYGAKLAAIALALTDPAHQRSHSARTASLQTEDDGWSMRTYPMALLLAFDWGYELFSPAQRAAIVAEIDSFIDTWDRGWAYPVVSGGRVVGAVVWHGPQFTFTPACRVEAGVGAGATCTATRTGDRVTSIRIDSAGSGYGGGPDSPYFVIGGQSAIPYGGGGVPLGSGTFDSNYYAPYYAVKALAGLLTAPDGANAAAHWADWVDRVHGQIVQPWYAAYRVGGGWPEGFQNYGEQAVRLMSLPAVAVRDAKGIDLFGGPSPFRFPFDAVDYMFHATWPSLDFVYDEGHGYAWNGPGTPKPGYAQAPFYRFLAGLARRLSHPRAAQFHRFAKDVAAATVPESDPANDFLWWSASDADAPYSTLPLSYLAQGLTSGAGHLFARSSWSRSAVWLGLNGGAYLDYSGQSEEKFTKGSFSLVRGDKPLLVVPDNWILLGGTAAEQLRYDHDFGNPHKLRDFANTFQVFNIADPQDTNQVSNLPPRVGATSEFGDARTAITLFVDRGDVVLATSRSLEDQYRSWDAGANGRCPVAAWTRQLAYLRGTSQVIVYDRTTTCHYARTNVIDQLLAFHFPARPATTAQSPVVPGVTRQDVTFGGTFMGSAIVLLPDSAALTVSDASGASVVWRLAVRSPSCTPAGCSTPPPASVRWLTVFDLHTAPGEVARASPLSATGMTGALLESASGNSATLFNAGAAGTTVAGPISYAVPAGIATRHLLSELPASTRYAASAAGGAVSLVPDAGGSLQASVEGVLQFTTDAAGNVEP